MKMLAVIAVLLPFLYLLIGCTQTTTSLWEKPTYTESINLFLTTKDKSEFVFIGGEYHYIFQNTSSLVDILNWEDRELLTALFYDSFVVDSSNAITGSYVIVCPCHNLEKDQEKWLEHMGFTRPSDDELSRLGGNVTYVKQGRIHGTRYLSGDVEFPHSARLNRIYSIQVEEERNYSFGGKMGRAALTPIAVAEDGVATIGLGAALIVAVPFVVIGEVLND